MTGMRCARHHRFKASSGCFGGRFPPFDWAPANGRNRRFPAIQACSSLRLAEVTAAFRDGSYAAQGEPRRVQC
jgi:hypothetical protein